MSNLARTIFGSVTAVTLLAAACIPEQPTVPSPPACDSTGGPLTIGVVQDLAAPAGVAGPRLTVEALAPLIAVLRCRGGEIAVTVIDGRDPALVRLRLDPRPAPPAQPDRTENRIDARRNQEVYERALTGWWAEHDRWDAAASDTIRRFQEAVTPLLARQSEPGADPWPSLRRTRQFYDEQRARGEATSRPWLLFVSERERIVLKCRDIRGERTIEPGHRFIDPQTGITWVCGADGEWHNAANLPPLAAGTIPAGPTVLPFEQDAVHAVVVKGAPGPGPLDELRPRLFEAIDPAIRFIAHPAR
jgi:hypothetical protein